MAQSYRLVSLKLKGKKMFKKCLLALVIITLAATGAFAQIKLSVGGGVSFSADFGGGVDISGYVSPYGNVSGSEILENSGFGFYGFLDIDYIEVSLSFVWGDGTATDSGNLWEYPGSANYFFSTMNIGVLGKYPIHMGRMIVFPALGIDYNMVSSMRFNGYEMPNSGDFTAMWIRFGGGFDYSINADLFIRGTLMYGVRLASKFENNLANAASNQGLSSSIIMGSGPIIRVGVGYRF